MNVGINGNIHEWRDGESNKSISPVTILVNQLCLWRGWERCVYNKFLFSCSYLHAITYSQDWYSNGENSWIIFWCILGIHAVRTPGDDDGPDKWNQSDQFKIYPTASPKILHHTAWRTWLFIAHSDHYCTSLSLPHLYTSLWKVGRMYFLSSGVKGLTFPSQEWSLSNFPCSLTRNITSQYGEHGFS